MLNEVMPKEPAANGAAPGDSPLGDLPRIPVLPYLRRPVPPHVFRFDLRGPAELFEEGFWAWGTGFDLCRHVAGFSAYQRRSGFVSTASDVTTALNMFISWKVGKADLTKAWALDMKLATYGSDYTQVVGQIRDKEFRTKLSLTPEKELEGLLNLYKKELQTLTKAEKVAESRKTAGWVEGWLYVIKPDPHYVSVEENLQDPQRSRLSGPRAVKLSGEATEWDAVLRIPPQLIRQAVKVRFTRIKTGPRKLAKLVHDVGLDIATNASFDEKFTYDPYAFSQGRYLGLIGYWAPVDTKTTPTIYAPGSVSFVKLTKEQWEGKAEFDRPAGPRHPFGRPAEVAPAYPAFAAKP
ncbi:hypothetical protein [Streptomyces sp. NBC_01477]|uniref:hypothetical protein n=1 Tax=Streptomyces sp. NBC_01477 TaxID=2976015 RepID=UPI002E346FA8|nr:hypothetical protein [Streptomyces sp. NBC_01477]